jgi:hypothetical protein
MSSSGDAEEVFDGTGEESTGGTAANPEVSRRDALVERLFGACMGALDLLHVYVGDRLGLYAALAAGPSTSGELAWHCGYSRAVRP